MGKIRRTYSTEFKMDIIDKYLNGGWSQTQLLQEYRIHNSMLQRWVNQYKTEGVNGLGENRGGLRGENKGRPRKNPLSDKEKIIRLEAEVTYLKKLLKLRRERKK